MKYENQIHWEDLNNFSVICYKLFLTFEAIDASTINMANVYVFLQLSFILNEFFIKKYILHIIFI